MRCTQSRSFSRLVPLLCARRTCTGLGDPRPISPSHTHACAHTPTVLLFGHLVSLANCREVSFPGSSAPFGRGSDSSSTASKQPPFRGSKYFATCYFSVIYYEHIFPFIRGFANSPESQNLAAALVQRGCASPPCLSSCFGKLQTCGGCAGRRSCCRSQGLPPAPLNPRDTREGRR